MDFDFYYGAQAEQFSFIKIPRVMISDNLFSELSLQAKILYSILLDRMTLSRKNGWFDEENRVYIIYPINDIITDLGFSRKKAMEYLTELELFGLVEKKKRGFGLPSIIYVKSFLSQSTYSGVETVTTGKSLMKPDHRSSNIGTSRDVKTGTTRTSETDTTVVSKREPQDVSEKAPLNNKNNTNNTDMNNNKSNHIVSCPDVIRCDRNPNQIMQTYDQIIRENIEADVLLMTYPHDAETIQGIIELMLEIMISESDTILIASEKYPVALVKGKFMKLNYMHIEYILDCLHKNTTKVRNIKKYLLAALFNAPSTIDGYYRAEVNHDMPQFAG